MARVRYGPKLQSYPREKDILLAKQMKKHYGPTLLPDAPFCVIVEEDSRKVLPQLENCVDLIVTSPPYADARRKHYDSIHPDEFVEWFISFHDCFWDSLKPSGSLVINIKDKVVDGVRHRFVWHLIDSLSRLGWQCIDDYIWHKPNPMPGRWPTRLRDGWEYCFHLAKCKKPYMNQNAVRKPIGKWVKTRLAKLGENDLTRQNSVNKSGFGRNISKWVGQETVLPSNVLSIPLVGTNKGHPAAFPPELPSFFIKFLSPQDGLVLDPFGGSGMTGLACVELGRDCILIDNKHDYCKIARRNIDAAVKRKEYAVCSFTSSDFAHWINRKENKSPLLILRQRHFKEQNLVALTP